MEKITAFIDRNSKGLRFDGVGSVSAAGTSKKVQGRIENAPQKFIDEYDKE